MAPGLSYSRTDLGYPPWALDFDPYNRGYLLVSGGGGEGQKEVPNKLTLLDITARGHTSKAAELNLGSENDCPVSLGVLSTKDGLISYAGINSGAAERKQGVNKHLRSFKIQYPPRSKEKEKAAAPQEQASISPLGQTSIFSPAYAQSSDAFQRLLRVSPAAKRAGATKRIAAVASSLAKDSEIIVFDATAATPGSEHVIERITPLQNAEANDLDMIESKEGVFQIAFCTNTEIYSQTVSYDFGSKRAKLSPKEPTCVHTAPLPDAFQKPGRLRFRSIRYLTPRHLLVLANKAGQSELFILRVFPDGGNGDVVLRKILPKRMGAAVSMDVCMLDEDTATGARQIIIAVAAQSCDIAIYTIDYVGKKTDTMGTFSPFADLRDVHTMAMKKVALSPYFSPWPSEGSSDKDRKPGPQFVRLASISLSNTIVIDDLPLYPLTSQRGSRHYLQKNTRAGNVLHHSTSLFTLFFVFGVFLLLLQSYLNMQAAGGDPSLQIVPKSISDRFSQYAQPITDRLSPYLQKAEHAEHRLEEILHLGTLRSRLHSLHGKDSTKAIVIHSPDGQGLSTEVHAHSDEVLKRDVQAKRWEEMTATQQAVWSKKLSKAGAWAESEGETVLKGLFFSELAGAWGRAAAEALYG